MESQSSRPNRGRTVRRNRHSAPSARAAVSVPTDFAGCDPELFSGSSAGIGSNALALLTVASANNVVRVLIESLRACLVRVGFRFFRGFLKWGYVVALLLGLSGFCEAQENTLTNEWTLEIGAHSDSSPAVSSDGTVYFGDFDGRLWAVSSEGARKWVFQAGLEIKSSPAIGPDGSIYFGSRDRNLYALGTNGQRLWVFGTGGWVDSSPAVGSDGTVYFGSWDNNFYALKPDGSEKWRFKTGAVVVSSPAIDAQGRVHFGSHDGKFYALEPNGTKRWEFRTGGPIISSPALDLEGNSYFTSVDGFLYVLKADGTLRWRLQTGGVTPSSPVLGAEGNIYVGVNKQLWVISAEGKKLRSRPEEMMIKAAPLALAGGGVCFTSDYGMLEVLDADLRLKGSFYLVNGGGSASPGIGPADHLYLPGSWRYFHAFPSCGPLARSPWPKFRGDARNTGNVSALTGSK